MMNRVEKKIHNLLPLLLLFTLGGIFGFIYEEVFYFVDLGYIVKRGTTLGPWIPIYGFGAVLILLITKHLRQNPFAVFGASMIVCGEIEFVTGYVLYHMLEIRLWDYNTEIWNWGNIGGYICARSVLFFGMSGLFLIYVVYPIILWMQERLGETVFCYVSVLMAMLFVLDILFSLWRGRLYLCACYEAYHGCGSTFLSIFPFLW